MQLVVKALSCKFYTTLIFISCVLMTAVISKLDTWICSWACFIDLLDGEGKDKGSCSREDLCNSGESCSSAEREGVSHGRIQGQTVGKPETGPRKSRAWGRRGKNEGRAGEVNSYNPVHAYIILHFLVSLLNFCCSICPCKTNVIHSFDCTSEDWLWQKADNIINDKKS